MTAVLLALLLILAMAGCAGKVPFIYQYTQYANSQGGIILTRYTGQDTSVEIPSKIRKDPVVVIGQAFYNCTSLESVTIPDSVAIISEQAFYNCTSLASVIIPNSVTYISNQAFWNCTSLVSVTIPDSVTNISPSAFTGCGSLLAESRQRILRIQPDAQFEY